MNTQEIVRIVDNIARDKNLDRESIFLDLEAAMVSGAKKHYGDPDCDVVVNIDRNNGQITAYKDNAPIDIKELGRIPAQTVKQVMIQKIKADERDSIYTEYAERRGELITGTITRKERGSAVISLEGRAEAYLPKTEQIPGETHHTGERLRAVIADVREDTSQVKIKLSRTHRDFIRRLFEAEIPEIAEGIVEIRALSREAGYRTKIAVGSNDDRVDPVGACVGVRGSRIKNIVDELSGEKIDIVPWSDSSQDLITNAIKPAECTEIALCFELGRATAVVPESQLSLAIGKHGQNVRLAARLTGWDIDILTPDEYNQEVEELTEIYKEFSTGDEHLIDKFLALGLLTVHDIEEVGPQPLIDELGLDQDLAQRLVDLAIETLKAEKSGSESAE
ncbi:Transcription termination/antitermination protein NusA [Limihaloglobus sulfuriphilus]|uniref:Transcription termination/antitermination protein NusA n=1 Tax=Limihaloglobus sulfuriphilus TaxID=1851148 RepID=A0A1Q2MD72_9BACT|nr:transcription termination factor NusA [Limihaloglobus sulfuriphilus]AQQ70620.1 Transcription termination/antitermination protein NusA [Limihaloglobus sulfuriphilus]